MRPSPAQEAPTSVGVFLYVQPLLCWHSQGSQGSLESPRKRGWAVATKPKVKKGRDNPLCGSCGHPKSLHGKPARKCNAMGCSCKAFQKAPTPASV